MKTTKIFSILSLALIFATVSAAFAGTIDTKKEQPSISKVIQYRVNVHMSVDKALCNMWLVKVLDERGRQVAPAQPYKTGVPAYEFYERGPAEGARIAVLVKYTYGDHYECETELFTEPAILTGTFRNGQTYRFDLFPTTQPSKE